MPIGIERKKLDSNAVTRGRISEFAHEFRRDAELSERIYRIRADYAHAGEA